MEGLRSRTWCFTINNPIEQDEKDIEALIEMQPRYLIVGEEKGTLGTAHLQCYVRFKEAKTFSKIKKMFPRAHIEKAKGTDLQNRTYCSKEGQFIEYGTPSRQGKRTDIEHARDVVVNRPEGPMRALLDTNVNYQCVRLTEKLLTYKEKQRNWHTEVYWFHGKTGTGKTKKAFEQTIDPYVINNNTKWWDGYDAHEHVIIDDFRSDYCKFHILLRILDRYPYRVEFKGGYRQLLAKKIIITSAFHPSEVYQRSIEDINQLLRRIDKLEYFK